MVKSILSLEGSLYVGFSVSYIYVCMYLWNDKYWSPKIILRWRISITVSGKDSL